MESKSDIGNGPVINMERVPISEGQEIQRSDEKRANKIRNEGIKLRVKNIPVLEERRLLALERHIKRKRRRRPYVRKMKSSDKTEHQLGKTMVAINEKIPDDPGAFDFNDDGLQVFEGKEKEVPSQDEVEGTGMVVFDKYEKKQINLQATNDLIENFEVQSTKMNEAKDKQQDEQFDKLVECVLNIVKSEIAKKVEDELKSQSDFKHSQVKEESQIKEDERAGMKVKQEKEEKFTHVKEANTSPPEDARLVNDEDLKDEKENFHDEELKHLERAKDNDNKIVDIGDENAEQSCNTSRTRSKEPTQKDPDDGDDGKTGFNTRNKVAIDDEKEEEEEEDDDEGFMPRKLFFFSFSEFKKEETSA